jgi:hypothetical protein
MLSLFSSKRSQVSKDSKSRQKSSKKSTAAQLRSERDGVTERQAMEGADRELYRYDQPKQDLGMSDLIKNHEDGTRFMYAAVTGRKSETTESKLRRLIDFKPTLRKKSIPIDNLPTIKLYRETETFPLDQIMPKSDKKSRELGTYMRISDAVTLYGALVSPDCNFTKVQVGITDNRLMSDRMVKAFTATTNVSAKGNLALPYCVPVEDADQLILTISRERSFIEEGRQWGAIQVQLVLEFMDFPMQFDNQPVLAVNALPSTALETPVNNPNTIDISIMNQDRKHLAELFLSGELADENEPIVNKSQAVKYAKSSIAGATKGKVQQAVTSDWSFMSQKRTGMIDADQNSIEPEEDDLSDRASSPPASINLENLGMRPATPPKSVLKRTTSSPMSDSTVVEEPRTRVKFNTNRITPF